MKKIPTIFPKNPENLGLVIEGPMMSGIDHFKIKIDGTACMIKDGKPYKRFDAKLFKKKRGKKIEYTREEVKAKLPVGAIPCQEPDEKSGHWPHWVPVTDSPEDAYIMEGFENASTTVDGTYECIGPKIQNNPHGEDNHVWIPHFSEDLIINIENIDFHIMEEWLETFQFEGLVAYNKNAEPIGKIRRSDFGYEKIQYQKMTDIMTDFTMKIW